MKHSLLLFLCSWLLAGSLQAQLPDGSIAPDWTHNDIYGNSHNLYSLLDQGKMVVLKFSATWCGPCWNYLQTGALETFWNEHGPNGSNEAQVFYIEADQNTGMADLLGQTSSSQGNWVAAIPFPIIDLQWGENTDNDYQIAYYPTLYAVCQDRKIYELGQVPAWRWAEFLQSCALSGEVSNIEEAICYGDGSATILSSGGVNPITYSWNNGQTGPVLNNVGAGTYSATITEANGRTVEVSDIVITGASQPITLAESQINPVLCNGSSTGGVEVTLQYGVPPMSYSWSNGSQSQNLTNVSAGGYSLQATDGNGCTYSGAFTVTQPPALTADPEATAEYCDQVNGVIQLDIAGGVGGYSVSASSGTVIGFSIYDLAAGNVQVFVEDNNGCIWSETVGIEYVPEHDVYFSSNPQISCAQPTTTIIGYVNGGSADYSFEWTTVDGNIVGPNNFQDVLVDQAGQYTLAVFDLTTGCYVENSIAVTADIVPPSVHAGEDAPISCENQNLTLQGTGDAGNTVSWTTLNGNIVSGGDTYTPLVDAPGQYILLVMDPSTQCTNTDTVTIVNNFDPAEASYHYTSGGLTLAVTSTSTGSNLSGWMWSFGDGSSSAEPNAVHTFAEAGIYEVCLSVENGCGTSQTCQQVEVTTSGSVLTVLAEIHHVVCFGEQNGSISIMVNGGSGNYTYSWTAPDGSTYDTPSIADLPAGVYQLVISDDEGNIFIDEFVVIQPELVVLESVTIIDNVCFGESNGSASIELTGGIQPYTYLWSTGHTDSNTIDELAAGEYGCTITDQNGCLYTVEVEITEPEILAAEHINVVDPSGAGHSDGSISIEVSGGTAPYAVTWNNGMTGTDISGLPVGSYTYTIVDAKGCVLALQEPIVLGIVSTTTTNWAAYITIRPNPSNGNALVQWNGLEWHTSGTLTLLSSAGQQLAMRQIASGNGQWDLSSQGLSSGVYIVMLRSQDQVVPFKLVVM